MSIFEVIGGITICYLAGRYISAPAIVWIWSRLRKRKKEEEVEEPSEACLAASRLLNRAKETNILENFGRRESKVRTFRRKQPQPDRCTRCGKLQEK